MATVAMTREEVPCGTRAEVGGLERTRFYPRQLVGPDDLTQDQRYFRDKARRHNRMLHGWGIVCGACVRRNPLNTCEVVVDPGYILGPYGDEIMIGEPTPFDLCKQGVAEQVGCCPETADPWCAEPKGKCPEGRFFLAVKYTECPSRPVRSGGCSCGCEDDGCEYTRIRDSFALKLLTELPPPYTTPMSQPSMATLQPCLDGSARVCPPCPREPWVILADVVVGPDCRIVDVDCFAHRRYVMSYAEFYWTCAPRRTRPGLTIPAGLLNARLLNAMAGGSDLIDSAMAASAEAPRAMVTMRRSDGAPVAVPAFFNVQPGETIADLVEREGDRTFFDPVSDSSLTLRELYAHADVDPATPLSGAAAALAPLEGRPLDVAGFRAARETLTEVLDTKALDALDRQALGSLARAGELPASAIAGIGPASSLGRRVRKMTIADVAAADRDAFVADMVKGTPAAARTRAEAAARTAWEAASTVARIGKPNPR